MDGPFCELDIKTYRRIKSKSTNPGSNKETTSEQNLCMSAFFQI